MAQLEIDVNIPDSLIQLCETHPDRNFQVQREKTRTAGQASLADTQDQLPKWNLPTHSIQPRHPLAAWLWLHDPIYRVSPAPLRQRMFLEAMTEWQIRCATLDFPRVFSRKKALEGIGANRPDEIQAKAVLYAMERYKSDEPVLWVLWNDEKKSVSFLDEKKFPKVTYKHIWIIREGKWDRLWDASQWKGAHLASWLQDQEKAGFHVEWPAQSSATTQKAMASEYEKLGFIAAGLSKDELHKRLARTQCIRTLCE